MVEVVTVAFFWWRATVIIYLRQGFYGGFGGPAEELKWWI